MEQQHYSLFYDTGCCDMFSRYESIKSIRKRPSKEFPEPVMLGGIGNAQVISTHGIYQVKLLLFNGNDAVLSGVCLDKSRIPKISTKGSCRS